jgi:hypothetical protein
MRALGRKQQFDEESRKFPVRSLMVGKKPRSYTWRCNTHLDQGSEGACVGFAVAHELAARPSEVQFLNNAFGRRLYHEAQKIDRWPGGAYPGAYPFYEGTSVLAGVKKAHKLEWFKEYRWAFGLDDLIMGVGRNGPAVLGVNWYSGMFRPDSNNRIHADGSLSGGHAILCNAVNVKKEMFTLHNSWGKAWGINGECQISFSDMDKLLKENGEAVFFIKRTTHYGKRP